MNVLITNESADAAKSVGNYKVVILHNAGDDSSDLNDKFARPIKNGKLRINNKSGMVNMHVSQPPRFNGYRYILHARIGEDLLQTIKDITTTCNKNGKKFEIVIPNWNLVCERRGHFPRGTQFTELYNEIGLTATKDFEAGSVTLRKTVA